MLATFELARGTVGFYRVDTIQFCVFGTLYLMSLTKFFIRLGLYDAEFIRTPAYVSLLISRPSGESLKDAWHKLTNYPTYEQRQSKATSLQSHAL